ACLVVVYGACVGVFLFGVLLVGALLVGVGLLVFVVFGCFVCVVWLFVFVVWFLVFVCGGFLVLVFVWCFCGGWFGVCGVA
ncbi:hypothetical protein ABTK02_22440, partial [Acinetobacter baumannii]